MTQQEWPTEKPSISYLSYQYFDSCERKWFNHYCHDTVIGDLKCSLRQQHKLMPWSALAGQVVDDTLSEALIKLRDTGEWSEDLIGEARQIYQRYIDFSVRFADAVTTKKPWPKGLEQPLDRYYYGEIPTNEQQRDVAAKVKRSLKNFEESSFLNWLKQFDASTFRCAQRDMNAVPPWFQYEGVPIFAKYDFAITTPDHAYIIDWKTSDPSQSHNEKNVKLQLHGYAAYAISEWGYSPENITLIPFWLATDSRWFEEKVDLDLLNEIRESWIKRHALLKARIVAHSDSPSDLVNEFPLTSNTRECRWCTFRSCPGYERVLTNPVA